MFPIWHWSAYSMHFSVNPNLIIDSVCTHEERRVHKKGAPSWRCRVLSLWTKKHHANPLEYLAKRLHRGSDHLSWCYQKLPRCRSWRIRALWPRWIVLSDKKPSVLGAVLMLWDDCLESFIAYWDILVLLPHVMNRWTTPKDSVFSMRPPNKDPQPMSVWKIKQGGNCGNKWVILPSAVCTYTPT